MDLLPLNDPRWLELDHRNWFQGKRSSWVPEAPFVPDELSKLRDNPADLGRFNDLWPWVCSEGTAWAAAYAVVPYAVEFAERLAPERRFDYCPRHAKSEGWRDLRFRGDFLASRRYP